MPSAELELRDVAPGLWLWRQPHPDWRDGLEWEPLVSSFCVESGGEVVLLDPLAPPEGTEFWARLEARPPTVLVVLKPDHVRSVDLFADRYPARAFGPRRYFRGDVPETELEPYWRGGTLPGGLLALDDGRGEDEKPVYLPEQRALVFADGMNALGGELRVWAAPLHERRTLPALRDLLELPFELVLVSHGEPVHDRAAFERALQMEPWSA